MTSPYWQSACGRYTLYHGDCLEVLPTLAAGSVDAVVTDPPYGMGLASISGVGRSKAAHALDDYEVIGDDSPFDPTPVLRAGVPTILWGGNHFASRLPDARRWLVWDKREGGTPDDQADCEMAWTNLDGPSRLFSHRWRGMIKASERDERRVHPTQKPVALMEWCIEFVPDATTILDPFLGSGTSLVACVKTGRRGIGIEIDERYCEIAAKRIEREADHLFAEVQP